MSTQMSLNEFYKWQKFFKYEQEQSEHGGKQKTDGKGVFDNCAALAKEM